MNVSYLLFMGILAYGFYKFIDFMFPNLWEENRHRKFYLAGLSILFGIVGGFLGAVIYTLN